MAAYLFTHKVKDDEYIRRVRRFTPSSMLPLISQVGAQYWEPNSWLRGDYMKLTPWALADIARVSLVAGNEHRPPATREELLKCAGAYSAMIDPSVPMAGETDALIGFLLRKASEQFAYNQSRWHDLGRTMAIFQQTTASKPLQVLESGWIETLFGCSLSQYVGIAFIVHTLAVKNAGRFSESWLDHDEIEPITSQIPVDLIRQVIEAHFTGDPAFFQQERPCFRPSAYRRFTFNPLIKYPIVSGFQKERLVPVPGLVDRKVSPLGLWFSGFEQWGNAFSSDVGELFEQYIGRQLELLPDADVHPEVLYDSGQNRSVDWIVVCPTAVLLVEVKSVRPTEPIRLGSDKAFEDLGKKLGNAYAQIEKTNALIENSRAEFSWVPRSLPRIGIVATMESFPLANSPLIRDRIAASRSIPTIVCSTEEIEILVTINDEAPEQFLMNFLSDPEKDGWDIGNEVRKVEHNHRRNEVLDAAWVAYKWSTPPDDDEDSASDKSPS